MRAGDRREPGAPRLPATGDRGGPGRPARLLRRGPGRRRLRGRHRAGGPRAPREPRLPVSGRVGSARRCAGGSLPVERPGAGVAHLVLPLEQHSRRRVAGRRRAEAAAGSRRPGAAGAADAGRSAVGGAGEELRRPVAAPAEHLGRPAVGRALSRLRREPAAGLRAGDRAVLRQRHARGRERHRAADCRLHVPQRTVGAALRHRRYLRQRLPARGVGRPQPARPAGSGQHPDRHLVLRPHVAGRARQVGAGERPGDAAAAAAAERAGAGPGRGLGQGAG